MLRINDRTYLTIPEAALEFDVPVEWVKETVEEGYFPAVDVAGTTYISWHMFACHLGTYELLPEDYWENVDEEVLV